MIRVRLNHNVVNLVYTTDWHLSDVPPGRRHDDYRAAILEKIEFQRSLTEKLKGAGLCGADVFHVKNPKSSANSIGLIVALLQLLRRFPTGCIYGSVGNHDLSWDRMDSLSHQPLGLLMAAGAYHNLNEQPVMFENEDGSVQVQVETFPYADGETTLKRLMVSGPRHPDASYRVGIVHAFGVPGNNGTYFGELKIGYNTVKDLDFDFLLWGHDHSRKETETVGNITHVNLGSLARAAFDGDEIDRPVTATVLSFGKAGIKYQEKTIPVKPLEVTFRAADKGMEGVSRSEEVTEFFNEMDEQVDGVEAANPREVLKELCPDDPPLLDLTYGLCEI